MARPYQPFDPPKTTEEVVDGIVAAKRSVAAPITQGELWDLQESLKKVESLLEIEALEVERLSNRELDLVDKIEARDATIARLREALEFYGAAETWEPVGQWNLKSAAACDNGKRALEALGK